MSTGQLGNPSEQQVQSTIGNASFVKGKWLCECRVAARCRTATKNSVHQGNKFWRCANVDNRQCSFFLWVVHEAAAKEWLKISQPDANIKFPIQLPRQAETPKKSDNRSRDDSEIETPFTKAKRRRQAPTDATKYSPSGAINGDSATGINDPFVTPVAPQTPNKAARTSNLATPTQRFAEKLRIGLSPPRASDLDLIPISNHAEHAPVPLGPSPISTRDKLAVNAGLRQESSLTSTVFDLIRSDNVELKPSTEIQIRHEIDLVVDVGKAKVQRYEETIYKLHERIDELEKLVLHFTE